MESPNTLHRSRGFTIIEILIAIGLLAIIFSFGLFISFDFYKSYSIHSERNIIVSILQKARSQALDNINQQPHGVHFQDNFGLEYIIFEGPVYDALNPGNFSPIKSASNITITSPTLPFDVVFTQLSANSSDKTITISDGIKSYDVSVNQEGRINW